MKQTKSKRILINWTNKAFSYQQIFWNLSQILRPKEVEEIEFKWTLKGTLLLIHHKMQVVISNIQAFAKEKSKKSKTLRQQAFTRKDPWVLNAKIRKEISSLLCQEFDMINKWWKALVSQLLALNMDCLTITIKSHNAQSILIAVFLLEEIKLTAFVIYSNAVPSIMPLILILETQSIWKEAIHRCTHKKYVILKIILPSIVLINRKIITLIFLNAKDKILQFFNKNRAQKETIRNKKECNRLIRIINKVNGKVKAQLQILMRKLTLMISQKKKIQNQIMTNKCFLEACHRFWKTLGCKNEIYGKR